MRQMLTGFFIPALLCLFTPASAQLPPKVIADKYLLQAQQLLEKKDYEAALNLVEKTLALQKEHGLTLSDNLYFKDAVAQLLEKKDYRTALNTMDRFIALQKEHSLTLPDEFHFQYAQATFLKYEQMPVPADSIKVVLESVSRYLSAETEGEFYREAPTLFIEIEEKLEGLEFSPERTCAGKPVGSSCWLALANQPECYVWNPDLEGNDAWDWTGACSGSLTEGEGTISWNYSFFSDTIMIEETGYLQNGRRHGQWVSRVPWRGSEQVEKITYANGVLHGRWVNRDPDGTVVRKSTYVNGERQSPLQKIPGRACGQEKPSIL